MSSLSLDKRGLGMRIWITVLFMERMKQVHDVGFEKERGRVRREVRRKVRLNAQTGFQKKKRYSLGGNYPHSAGQNMNCSLPVPLERLLD